MTIQTILVAHDGSEGAAHALDFALDLARQTGARLVAVHAWTPLEELGRHPPPVEFSALREEAVTILRDEWCAAARAAGVPYEVRVIEDLPVAGVVRAARECGADLIVCGTRGRGRVKELVLGSVARELPMRAHLPVTIVPPAR